MDYQSIFAEAIAALHAEKRYRVFADLERIAGRFPYAIWRSDDGRPRDRRLVLQRLSRHGPEPDRDRRHGRGGPARWASAPAARATSPARTTRWSQLEAELADLHGKEAGAGLHLRLRLQRGGDLDHRQAAARLRDPLGRAEPRLDDRGHPALGRAEADLPPQRPRPSREPAQGAAPERPKLIAFEVGLFDGRRHRADRRDRRPRREIRRDDLSRRGARGRHVRAARRRHRRARRRHGPHRRDRGHARQGLRRARRLHRRQPGGRRRGPLLCAGLHLHHRAAAGDRRRGTRPRSATSRRRRPSARRSSATPR